MRLPLIAAPIFCFLSLAFAPGADASSMKEAADGRKGGLIIRVEGGGWGGDSAEKIETVLHAVAEELLTRPSKKLATPIVVTHTASNPIALYDRGRSGEYQVRLHASGARWHLYVFEFAHEFCHLMSNYDENVGKDIGRHNQWFEEALCETASLFVLERLASKWGLAPPAPEWSTQARQLRLFFNLLVAEKHRQLPPQIRPAAWLSDKEAQLRRDPYQREQNDLVAKLLLPLFEQDRKSWDALRYLNLDPTDTHATLAEYLRHWYDNAPEEHKAFIAAVRKLLGAGDVPPSASAAITPDASVQQAAVAVADAGANIRPWRRDLGAKAVTGLGAGR